MRVYAANVEPPKRLKSLIASRGEDEFRRLVEIELEQSVPVSSKDVFDKTLLPVSGTQDDLKLVVPVFAGELSAERLGLLVGAAKGVGIDYLQVTTDQNVALLPAGQQERQQLIEVLTQCGFDGLEKPYSVLRVCPGSHECRMGLTATRSLAEQLQQRYEQKLVGRSLAISGCANSCAQPQLADIGLIAGKSVKADNGLRTPRFDLYLRTNEGLGTRTATDLSADDLLVALDDYFLKNAVSTHE